MAEFIPLCKLSELPVEGEAREVTVGATIFCVARVKGEIAVLENDCPHRGGPLGQGVIEEGRVVCPWHAWAFDVKDGTALHDEAARVKVYEVKLEGDQVLIKSRDSSCNSSN
jgi:nitrite reductase (NADH) small subunit